MIANFFHKSTYRKQRVNKKQNIEIDSAVLSGGQREIHELLAYLILCLKQHY
jgi:hypothetical protein